MEVTYDSSDNVWASDKNKWSIRSKGPCFVNTVGNVRFCNNNHYYQSRNGGPSGVYPTGLLEYRVHDSYHRTDGPAVITEDGIKEYWVKGEPMSAIEFFLKYGVI